MIRRFQIEDLIVQDLSGVVFRALDTETGKVVAVRRFFPFGANGGGLNTDEQAAYHIAVGRLAGLRHPAMRAIICGGCDPIDGMPFIATEWIEGPSIQDFIKQGPIPVEVATELITQALEVCELLSNVLAEEAVWVETELPTIIAGHAQSDWQFTFWISPLKWMDSHEPTRGLESIITLTEEIMGWQGRSVNNQAGRGLGGWLNWLRHAAPTTRLHEARETLAAAVGVEHPPPAKTLVAQATRPLARAIKPPSFKTLWIPNLALALVAVGLGAWFLVRQRAIETALQTRPPALTASPRHIREPANISEAAFAMHQAAEQPALTRQADEQKDHILTEQKYAASKNGGVIQWNSRELLAYNEGSEVVAEGVLLDIASTKTRMYLLFSKPPERNDPRGVVLFKSAAADLTAAKLTPLIGKKVRLRGSVDLRSVFGRLQTEITIKDRASIEVVE